MFVLFLFCFIGISCAVILHILSLGANLFRTSFRIFFHHGLLLFSLDFSPSCFLMLPRYLSQDICLHFTTVEMIFDNAFWFSWRCAAWLVFFAFPLRHKCFVRDIVVSHHGPLFSSIRKDRFLKPSPRLPNTTCFHSLPLIMTPFFITIHHKNPLFSRWIIDFLFCMSQDCLNVPFFGWCQRLRIVSTYHFSVDVNVLVFLPGFSIIQIPTHVRLRKVRLFPPFFCVFLHQELIFLKRAQTSRCMDPSGNTAVAMAAVQSTKGDDYRRDGTKDAAEKDTADPDDGSSRCVVAHPRVGLVEERTSDTTHFSFLKQIWTCGT